MPPAVALRPRSFSELFDAAFLLAREHFRPLATLSALVAVPAIALNVVNVALLGPLPNAATATPNAVLQTLPLTLVAMCWYFVGVAALLHAASDGYLGRPVDPGASLRRAVGRAGPLIGSHLLAYLAALAALVVVVLLLVVVGAVISVGLSLAGLRGAPLGVLTGVFGVAGGVGALAVMAAVLARYVNMSAVVMLEDEGAVAALRRSRALGTGHLRRIVGLFAILIVLSIVFSVVAFGLGALARNAYVSNLVATLFAIPLYPLMACVLTALYYDLRIRKEGFDIAHAAQELGEAPQPAPVA